MCMCSFEVEAIDNTKILVARVFNQGEDVDENSWSQLTVYSNQVQNENQDNMMIVAVPHPESVEFVDLSHYEDIFIDMGDDFVEEQSRSKMVTDSMNNDDSKNSLKITEVGSFLACTMKTLADHQRLPKDVFPPLSSSVLEFLSSKYGKVVNENESIGFIVCKLKVGDVHYHPFAYTHRCHGQKLFIPTMHYHPVNKSFFSRIWKVLSKKDDHQVVHDWDHDIYVLNSSEEAVLAMESAHNLQSALYRRKEWKAGRCSLQFDKFPTNVMLIRSPGKNVEHFARFTLSGSFRNLDFVV